MELRLLKSKRVLKGLTQKQVAKKIGINTKSYNLKENGKVKFSIEEAFKTSKCLGLTLDEFNDVFLQK